MFSYRLSGPRYNSIESNTKKSSRKKITYKITNLDENMLNEINSDLCGQSSIRSGRQSSTRNNEQSKETIIDTCVSRYEFTILKTGATSIILGRNHYNGYFQYKPGKLLKVTKLSSSHNDLAIIPIIKNIKNYKTFYSISDIDDELSIIKPEDKFYTKLMKLVKQDSMNIFFGNLNAFYIDFAGEMDVLDSLNLLELYNDRRVWKNFKSINNFINHLHLGLYYLQEKKVCHLDIKPENIMISLIGKNPHFRIIDFGFASIEPFDDYITNIRGTPGYFPKEVNYTPSKGLHKIVANDMILINGNIPLKKNYKLVYKIDSFCLGRVLGMIYDHFLDKYLLDCNCFQNQKKIIIK